MANSALFRVGTSDKNVWESVAGPKNEYRLPDRFESNSLILDIGGNIGAFAYACIQRGAGKVISFEPDPDNYCLFRKQLKAEIKAGKVEVYPLAVVGGSGFSWRTFSGVVAKDGEINHGGAFLFTPEGGDYGLGQYIVNQPFRVPCIGWEDIIPEGKEVALAKWDAEGAEWEIMCARDTLSPSPEKVIGEYHGHSCYQDGFLKARMEDLGYETEVVPHPNSEMGLFFATRK